jgi:acyl-homoserine lactone acylase PvdQ
MFGASLNGVPAISVGLNKHFAWGSTASYVDNKDLYL